MVSEAPAFRARAAWYALPRARSRPPRPWLPLKGPQGAKNQNNEKPFSLRDDENLLQLMGCGELAVKTVVETSPISFMVLSANGWDTVETIYFQLLPSLVG